MTSSGSLRAQLESLDNDRQLLERQISKLQQDELGFLGPTHELNCALIDADGYPLPVDVYSIRFIRNERAKLITNLKAINAKLEQTMLKLHAMMLQNEDDRGNDNFDDSTPSIIVNTTTVSEEPMLLVESVMTNSPAELAMLQEGDKIIVFGTLRHSDIANGNLSVLSQYVSQRKDQDITLVVLQAASLATVELILTPTEWDGPGLLGCKVVPC